MYAILIGEAGTSRATVITYVNPVVAVTLGVLVLGEQPGAGAVAGLLLILTGGWLATDGRLPPARERRAATPKSTLDAPPSSSANFGAIAAASTLRAGSDFIGPHSAARRIATAPPGMDVRRRCPTDARRSLAPKTRYEILIRTIVFTTNAIANPTVHAIQVALDERPATERAGARPHAERARQPCVLARMHQDQEHQDDAQEDLDDAENRAHCRSMLARSMSCMIVIASPRRVRSSSLVVGVRELAGAVVEVGVAELAVLGLARGLEIGEV